MCMLRNYKEPYQHKSMIIGHKNLISANLRKL